MAKLKYTYVQTNILIYNFSRTMSNILYIHCVVGWCRLKLLGASGEAPLLGGWRSTPHTPHTPATPAPHHSHNHLAPHCNGTDR